MSQLTNELQRYLSEVTHHSVEIQEIPEARQTLPIFMGQQYEFFRCRIFDRIRTLLVWTGWQNPKIQNISKHLELARSAIDQSIVFVFPNMLAFQRQRLIQHQIPFIVPKRHIYLPEAIIDIRTIASTTIVEDESKSKQLAAKIIDECAPKAVLSVETIGPNKKGVKHSGAGYDTEAQGNLAGLEYLFYEAASRGILTIGVIDRGNEIGSGTIEEAVRKITPYADVCRCPCQAGTACAVKTDIVFPASVSNWGAYAISAMMGYLLKKPEILQDDDTERRMLEACIMAGAVDGIGGRPIMSVDGVGLKGQQGIINLLHAIIENALKGS